MAYVISCTKKIPRVIHKVGLRRMIYIYIAKSKLNLKGYSCRPSSYGIADPSSKGVVYSYQ